MFFISQKFFLRLIFFTTKDEERNNMKKIQILFIFQKYKCSFKKKWVFWEEHTNEFYYLLYGKTSDKFIVWAATYKKFKLSRFKDEFLLIVIKFKVFCSDLKCHALRSPFLKEYLFETF